MRVDPERPFFLGGPPEPGRTPTPSGPVPPPDPRVPGEPGLWVFLLGDATVFGALFVGVLVYRLRRPEVFRASAATLSVPVGTVNTVVLLTSSLVMATAVAALRSDRDAAVVGRTVRRLLAGVVACAAVFAALKIGEYVRVGAAGHGPASDVFFTLYYALTAIHLLHLAIGTVLVVVLGRILAASPDPAARLALARGVASYWHLVDLLWIVLFPLLYLVPTS